MALSTDWNGPEVRACCPSPEALDPKYYATLYAAQLEMLITLLSHSCLNSLRKFKWDSTGF
jgi:hypothetical protein